MPTLSLDPNALGFFAPTLGPWFDTNTVNLPVPNADLSITLNALTANALPPVAGVLSFYIATAPRPPALAGLRQADGTPAFTTGNLVALYRLLPEAESRLHALSAALPSFSGAAFNASVPTRPRVRTLAFEVAPPANMAALVAMMHTGFTFPAGTAAGDQPTHLGLTLNGVLWGNANQAMNDMYRPGFFNGQFAQLLRFNNQNVTLWSFDSRGRPLDPGAVANWWSFLASDAATGFGGGPPFLWEATIQAGDRRTAPAVAQRTVHLVNAHEGPLEAAAQARLNLGNLAAVGGSTVVYQHTVGNAAATLGVTAAGTPDTLPSPLAAVLPDGVYAAAANVWATGPLAAALTRDFCRIAVVSVEHQLVGQRRDFTPPAMPTAADQVSARRASEQDSPAYGVRPGRVTAPVLLDTHELALGNVAAVFNAGVAGSRELVTSVLERGWGPLPALVPPAVPPPPLPQVPLPVPPGLPTVPPPPPGTPTVTALPLTGTVASTTLTGQRALLSIAIPGAPAGAWVRAWTQGFDPAKGERYHLDGGTGIVDATGTVQVVVDLPDGTVTPDALMGVDLVVVTAQGSRLYGDARFPRPPTGGPGLLSFASLVAGDTLLVPETGATLTVSAGPALNGTVPSGANLVRTTTPGTPALINPTTLPPAARDAGAIINLLAGADRVELTQPAFQRIPPGEAPTAFTGSVAGLTVSLQQRALLNAWEAGYPLHGMERLEVVLGHPGAGQAVAASVPSLARYHERLPHKLGHPLSPAAVEIHGTGAVLRGPGALSVLEYTRDRTASNTATLAQTAITPLATPANPGGAACWAVGLRTVGAGVEAELGLPQLLDLIGGSNHSFTQDWNNAVAWWNAQVPAFLQLTGNEAGDAPRALDRRMLAARGAREGVTSLLAAIARAEDFIYIETPALDGKTFGATDDTVTLLQALINRMDVQRALQVILCVPLYLLPGTPRALQRVRDSLLLQACNALTASPSRAARFVRFSPAAGPGRSLRLASTTVIVDDAYALTGTTHLWRRGLSFDSSYAVAVFDENLAFGRPLEVVNFRRNLLAGRLGLNLADLPEDTVELVAAINTLRNRGGFGSLAVASIPPPDPNATAVQNALITDEDAWNPDGSLRSGFDPAQLLASLMANDVSDEFSTPQP